MHHVEHHGPRGSLFVPLRTLILLALALSVTAFAAVAAHAGLSFGARTDLATGTNPTEVAIGDLNGDGVPDLVVANYGANTVSVLLSDGHGGYGAKSDYATGANPVSVAIGDMNGDGMPDLVVTNWSSSSVSVLLGNGSGGFSAKTDFGTASRPISGKVADLNGDGHLDVIVASRNAGNIQVLLGDGAGGLGGATNYSTGTGTFPYAVAIADLNGDGKLDVVTANQTGGSPAGTTVSVLLGNGLGGFGTKTSFTVGTNPYAVAVADLNSDGVPDVVVANLDGNTVSVLLGDGTGSFWARTDYPTGTAPAAVAIGDLDLDGKLDIAVAAYGSNTVSVLAGDGLGGFAAKTDLATGTGPRGVTIADLDGDGNADLVVPNFGASTVSVLLNTGVRPVFAGLQHVALGSATLTAAGDSLVVGNLGASGNDGVEIGVSGFTGTTIAYGGPNQLFGAGDPSERLTTTYLGGTSHGSTATYMAISEQGMPADKPKKKKGKCTADFSGAGASAESIYVYNGIALVYAGLHPNGQPVYVESDSAATASAQAAARRMGVAGRAPVGIESAITTSKSNEKQGNSMVIRDPRHTDCIRSFSAPQTISIGTSTMSGDAIVFARFDGADMTELTTVRLKATGGPTLDHVVLAGQSVGAAGGSVGLTGGGTLGVITLPQPPGTPTDPGVQCMVSSGRSGHAVITCGPLDPVKGVKVPQVAAAGAPIGEAGSGQSGHPAVPYGGLDPIKGIKVSLAAVGVSIGETDPTNSLAPGASVVAGAIGVYGGAPGRNLGTSTTTKAGYQSYPITADFSSIKCPSLIVVVKRAHATLYSHTLSGTSVGTAAAMYRGCVYSAATSVTGGPGFVFTWTTPTTVTIGGIPFTADEVTVGASCATHGAFMANGIVDSTVVSVDHLTFALSGVPQLLLTGITSQPDTTTAGSIIAPQASSSCITPASTCVSVPVTIARTDATPVRGFSVALVLSANLSLCGTGIDEGSYLSDASSGTTFQVIDHGGGSYSVDGAILGLPCGATVPTGTLFTLHLAGSTGSGTGYVTATDVRLRDCNNVDLSAGVGAPVAVTIDSAGPPAITNLAAAQVKSGNSHAAQATGITVTYTAPAGGASVEVYRAPYGGTSGHPASTYPEYTGAPPTSPTYPPGPPWVLTAVSASGDHDVPPTRGYWYYTAFAKDACGNASAVSNQTPGVLGYFLGDVSDGLSNCSGDNTVSIADISALGAHYGAVLGASDALACLDVGPTTDGSVDGRPAPDDQLEFEDLILYAVNFGTVSAPQLGPTRTPASGDAVSLVAPQQVSAGQSFTVELRMRGAGDIQGVSSHLAWDHAVASPVSVSPGELLTSENGVAFSSGPGDVDCVVMGHGRVIAGDGVLATVTFQALAAGNPGVTLGKVDARDTQNHPATLGAGGSQLPAATSFAPAMPNPFARTTALAFALARPGAVTLAVYSVDGRRVATLVNETREAGTYRLQWDGRDASGNVVRSGLYYARLTTPQGSFTRTLVLTR